MACTVLLEQYFQFSNCKTAVSKILFFVRDAYLLELATLYRDSSVTVGFLGYSFIRFIHLDATYLEDF
jgi:hypothetical protein